MLEPSEKKRIDNILRKGMPDYRKAYSDRTAWLMAYMAELAYLKFNQLDLDKEFALKLVKRVLEGSKKKTTKRIIGTINKHYGYDHKAAKDKLEQSLNQIGWRLVKTISANATQAYVAYNDNFAVLAFRGTEADRMGDIKADIKAMQTTCPTGGRMHLGFKEQYDDAEFLIKEVLNDQNVINKPLFITGHSLGGAVATVAAKRLTANHKISACYTFGSPRVGTEEWISQFKFPIYRIVNSADPVPSIPFSGTVIFLIIKSLRVIKRTIPQIPFLVPFANWLERTMSGYEHAGNMRYLTDCKDGDFSKTKLLYTVGWSRRFLALLVGARPRGRVLNDHNIQIYRRKLMNVAEKRNP